MALPQWQHYLWCLLFIWTNLIDSVRSENVINGMICTNKATLLPGKYRVTRDIIVEHEGELRIQPGCQLGFETGVGITVRGILKAEGSPHENGRIRMTRYIAQTEQDVKAPITIRLVDGPSIFAGRLQLAQEGRWFSVCTNSRNWTEADLQVACRELGFRGGQFYNWFDHNPDSNQLLYESPHCHPSESSLSSCSRSDTKKFGSGVCDDHLDIGILCDPQPTSNYNHWRGIQFENAKYYINRVDTDINSKLTLSYSSISHVDIFQAGFNSTGNLTSAIEVIGVPPQIQHVQIKGSQSTAINITSPTSPLDIRHSILESNRGYGVFINSSTGRARIHNCTIINNGADGIRYVHHDPIIEPLSSDFCAISSLDTSQSYPTTLSMRQQGTNPSNKSCKKVLLTHSFREDISLVFTIHFLYIFTDKDDSAIVEVRDGPNDWSTLLLNYKVTNSSRPQSITTTGPAMWLSFHAEANSSVVVTIEVESDAWKTSDLNVTDTRIEQNNGRGIAVENIRNALGVHGCEILHHNYVAGVHVLNGSGDVNITSSRITNNNCDGVNISYAGGRQNISYTTVSNNQGRGIAVWFNQSSLFKFDAQNTILYKSFVLRNMDYGMLVGNFCGDSIVNVTQSVIEANRYIGLKILSCWREMRGTRKVYITSNNFSSNRVTGLEISPAVNMEADISDNVFRKHLFSALHIRNEDREELECLKTLIIIELNHFEYNYGYFVAGLGLSQHATDQKLIFTQNHLHDNTVTEPFPYFNPRNKVSAVVTILSSNVVVFRNSFKNILSTYDIGSHLSEPYSFINGTHNYFGNTEGKYVYHRIFDAKYRYNLAPVLYFPYLLTGSYLDTEHVATTTVLPDDFQQAGYNIGGEVNGTIYLDGGEYNVTRDIVINSRGELKITRGSKLKFARSVGMLIHGTLSVYGPNAKGVVFTSVDESTHNSAVVRLIGGKSRMEGRLQVFMDNSWGTVCNYKWTDINAALVCHQLGYVLNPDDWLLEPFEMQAIANSAPIHMSNVQCRHLDSDLIKCRAEKKGDFQNSCTHENDVGIKCYKQGWAGIRVSMTAVKKDLSDIHVENAGLFDAMDNILQPAFQVDFAQFNINNINISRNIHVGFGVIFGNPFFQSKISNCIFEGNEGHGVAIHSQGIWFDRCTIQENKASGIHYNPMLTHEQERSFVEWVDPRNQNVIILQNSISDIRLERDQVRFIILDKRPNIAGTYKINTDISNMFRVIAIGGIDKNSTAQLTVQDGNTAIDLKTKLLEFPYSSVSNSIILNYNNGNKPIGKIVLHISPFERRQHDLSPTIRVHNCDIGQNEEGISIFHYNRARGEWKERYMRVKNETIELYRSKLHDNRKQALYVITPHYEPKSFGLANITYLINETNIDGNLGGSIMQVSRDIVNSNNVFNWIIGGNSFSGNKENGIDVTFPYVWQSNLNETHTFYMQNNTVNYNRNFKLVVNGFFAKTFIRENNFVENACKKGLITLTGMEKLMVVERNLIENNTCRYMVEFHMDSHTDLAVNIPAYFKNNMVKFNRFSSTLKTEDSYQPNSYTIGLRGVQKIDVTNNVFVGNYLEYQLLAGIHTSSLDSYINARQNYWGTTIEEKIRDVIFDFDDWNSFAFADFSRYLTEPTLQISNQNNEPLKPPYFDVNYLGGRLYKDRTIRYQVKPYIIRSDITIMPGITLTIDPGVHLQFYPSVGILVLGALRANGRRDSRIKMTPFIPEPDFRYTTNGRYRKSVTPLKSQQLVRLCTCVPCTFGARQGFLELYNVSTLQWTPVCDKRFTERNAEVVCQDLGYQNLNVFLKFGPRLDVDPTYLSRIRTWPEPRQCRGHEEHYIDCEVRLNGDFRHVYSCPHTADFVFVFCGDRNLEKNLRYWGGIRFANPSFESKEQYPYDKVHNTVRIEDSVLEYVDIIGAGILHNEKSSALLSTFNSPQKFEYINVTKSASDGVNVIAPVVGVNLVDSRIEDNLGVGLNILELNGYEGNLLESTFTPLKTTHIPYNLFGFVDICESQKILEVQERILVYYRYHNYPMDCVKIFKSIGQVSHLGIRFLQLNLFDSTGDLSTVDKIRIMDGNIYNKHLYPYEELTFKSKNDKVFFKTKSKTLSIHIHANGATENYGFVAEIITLPALGMGPISERSHNLTYSIISRNRMGGAVYSSTGENNPPAVFVHNQFINNGIGMFGNFTSCEAAVTFNVRNTKNIIMQNNLIMGNQGGLAITTEGTSAGSRLRATISHNLITKKQKIENALSIVGNNEVVSVAVMMFNHITQNVAPYRDNIIIKTIHSNFSRNFVRRNTGRYNFAVYGYEKLRLQQYQSAEYNSFYENKAWDSEYSSTIYAGGTGQNYENNVLINLDNDFEIAAKNRSNDNDAKYAIDATNNWWGDQFFETAISGRIRDKKDFSNLLEIKYQPYYLNNITLVDGKCPPGWSGIGSTCFIYIGGVMTRDDAKLYCFSEEASMPYMPDTNEDDLRRMIREKQSNHNYYQRVWMLSLERPNDCVSYSLNGIEVIPCEERLPFICETDPVIRLVPYMDTLTIATLGAAGGALCIMLLCVCFWICKSRKRQQERLERRNSIRASKRSIRSASSGSLPSELSSCRRIISEQHGKPVKMVEMGYKGSFDSIEKAPSRFDSSSYFNSSIEDNQSYEICEAANHKIEFSDFEDKFENDSRPDFTTPPIIHPPYKYGYSNKAFIDSSYQEETEQQPPWGSSSHSTTESTAEIKRYLETSLDTNGRDDNYTSRSSPSNYSQEMPTRKQLLETDI
uniref:SRCR domain-containing protein n=1 Tax=Strigamia maritima TaxID=126957 RepID=T1IJ76_STRMM